MAMTRPISEQVKFTQEGAGAVDRTAQNKLREFVSVLDFGAALDGVTNDATALFNANAAAVAAKVPLLIHGVMHIGTATTITAPIVDGLHQMFSVTSNVTINNGQPVRPDWWGDNQNTLNYATNALPAFGGVVKLANKRYKPNNHVYGSTPANSVYFGKDNVAYIGEKMPSLSNDCRQLEHGTIVEGMCIAYANNIEFRDMGFDSGQTVADTYYGGAVLPNTGEGLLCTYPAQSLKDTAALRRGVRLHNIVGLCPSPSAATHALIVGEGYTEVVCTGEMLGCYGVHGIVIKCRNVRAEQFTSYCNNLEGVIIKSDAQATAKAFNIQIDKIFVDNLGPSGYSPYVTGGGGYGVMFNPAAQVIDRVQIGEIQAYNFPIGVGVDGNFEVSNVQIGSLTTDGFGTVGSLNVGAHLVVGSGSGNLARFQCANAVFRNHSKAIDAWFSGSADTVVFGTVNAVNITDVVLNLRGTSYVSISHLVARVVTTGIFRITGTPKLVLGQMLRDFAGAGTPTYTSSSGGIVPTLSNGWSQVVGNDAFGIDLSGGRVSLKGLIKPGTSNTICTLPQWAWPASTKRGVVQGSNGSTLVAVPIVVSATGQVIVNEVPGGTANCSTWLSLTGFGWDSQTPS